MQIAQMTITELYPQIQALQHADKLRLMQFLITEFAREEQISLEATPNKPAKTIDAMQAMANMAQPLGDENLARHFKDHNRQVFNHETAQ
jgi:hypothetical protein